MQLINAYAAGHCAKGPGGGFGQCVEASLSAAAVDGQDVKCNRNLCILLKPGTPGQPLEQVDMGIRHQCVVLVFHVAALFEGCSAFLTHEREPRTHRLTQGRDPHRVD